MPELKMMNAEPYCRHLLCLAFFVQRFFVGFHPRWYSLLDCCVPLSETCHRLLILWMVTFGCLVFMLIDSDALNILVDMSFYFLVSVTVFFLGTSSDLHPWEVRCSSVRHSVAFCSISRGCRKSRTVIFSAFRSVSGIELMLKSVG